MGFPQIKDFRNAAAGAAFGFAALTAAISPIAANDAVAQDNRPQIANAPTSTGFTLQAYNAKDVRLFVARKMLAEVSLAPGNRPILAVGYYGNDPAMIREIERAVTYLRENAKMEIAIVAANGGPGYESAMDFYVGGYRLAPGGDEDLPMPVQSNAREIAEWIIGARDRYLEAFPRQQQQAARPSNG